MNDERGTAHSYRRSDVAAAELVEELTRAMERGEPVDFQALRENHPGCADRIEQLLPVLGELHRFDARREPEVAEHHDAAPQRRLGDFEIVREIGRGGMGIVYQAEQTSLRRRVALKVLPLAAVLDERRLARFQIEARAAAGLHHENIVPIYSIGCERGVHYYAMQFIEGRTLAEFVQESAGPAPRLNGKSSRQAGAETVRLANAETLVEAGVGLPREVARLGRQAARALQYAHERGVVHRDIKPSNLLLDNFGRLWIADFGLALMQSGGDLSMTGDIVGTLRYMSPEQIRGDRSVLDERTDVYSLGVTLYEVLAGRPAFPEAAHDQLLRGIIERDPPPPRQLNPRIPIDLETIILKAMSKEPQDRYPSAGEMAADLGRYLDDQPVRARRPTLPQRVSRWTRRYQVVVWAVAAVLLVTTLAATGSYFTIHRAYSSEVELRRQAESAEQQANDERSKAEAQRDIAKDEHFRAHQNAWIALSGLGDVTQRMLQLGDGRNDNDQLTLEAMQAALKTYSLLDKTNRSRQNGHRHGKVGPEIYALHSRIGALYADLGEHHLGLYNYDRAIEALQRHAREHPSSKGFCLLAETEVYLAQAAILRRLMRVERGEEMVRKALKTAQQARDNVPPQQRAKMLVRLSMETGLLQFEIGKAKPGESSLLLALADHEARCSDDACDDDDRLLRVQVLTALGGHYLESSRADDACEAFQRACGLQEMMVVSREDLLGSRRGLAHALELLGETEESEEAYREAIRLAEDLTQEFPGRPLPRHEHALCLAGLARLMNQTGRPAEADRTSLLATQILEEVSQRFPHARNAHFSHAVVLYERSVALGARDAEEAESACCRGINAVEALKVSDGAHRRFQGLLAKLVARRAELEVDGGRLDSARDSLTQAKLNLRVAVEAFPHRADFARLNTRIAELHESLVQASAGSAARE